MIYFFINYLNKSKKFPFYFITPLNYSFGNSAENIFLASVDDLTLNKKILILSNSYFQKILKFKIPNKALLTDLVINQTSQKKYKFIIAIINFFLTIEFFVRRFFIIYFLDELKIKINELKRFPNLGLLHLQHYKEFTSYTDVPCLDLNRSEIKLNSDKELLCEKILSGIDFTNKKIVTLHVRDAQYKNDYDKRNYRNSSIKNYINTIRFLINKNYIVFRICSKFCNSIEFKDKNFFESSSYGNYSQLIDLYLIQKSSFFIGTSSGPRSVSELFGIPTLLTNLDDFLDFPLKKNDRVIFKKFFNIKKKRYFSPKEILEDSKNIPDPELYISDYILEENSELEILNATEEFLKCIENDDFQLTDRQKEFNNLLKVKTKSYFTENDNETLKFHIDSLKYIKRSKSMKGAILF
jgi:putative glycosyltransferase (TIGR04372 family)